jgi:hypothetical protein
MIWMVQTGDCMRGVDADTNASHSSAAWEVFKTRDDNCKRHPVSYAQPMSTYSMCIVVGLFEGNVSAALYPSAEGGNGG